jgi:hypothetical protein
MFHATCREALHATEEGAEVTARAERSQGMLRSVTNDQCRQFARSSDSKRIDSIDVGRCSREVTAPPAPRPHAPTMRE